MLKLLYVKWIRRHCRHICKLCEFKSGCDLYDYCKTRDWKRLKEDIKEWY